MSNMVEVKTADLTGAALDWAVAAAIGLDVIEESNGWFSVQGGSINLGFAGREYRPSTEWAQGGPLMDKYATMVFSRDRSAEVMIGGFWNPSREAACEKKTPSADGSSILVALCRAIVSAKLGDVVQVPAKLVRAGS